MRIVTAALPFSEIVRPVQFDHLLERGGRLLLLRRLRRLELRLVVHVRGVLLADELGDQFLDLVVVVQVLPHLVHKVFVHQAIEGVGQLVVDVFFVLALLEGHISLQVSVAQLQQLVILLQFALVFLEQLMVQVLVVDRCIVHRDVEADSLQLFVVGCCFVLQLLQLFGYLMVVLSLPIVLPLVHAAVVSFVLVLNLAGLHFLLDRCHWHISVR